MQYIKNRLLIFVLNILTLGKRTKLTKKFLLSKLILEKTFQKGQPFKFVQVGANDGISFDFLYDFVTLRSTSGVVIEPVKDYHHELYKNYSKYPKIKPVNVAIHPFKTELDIYKIDPAKSYKYPEWVKGIASFDPEHHKKTGLIDTADMITETVKADTLMNILDANYVPFDLDYFQVDTEGFDFEVVKQIDFEHLRPAIVKYEKTNLIPSDKVKISELFRRQGYYQFDESGDAVAIDLKRVKLI